MPKRLEDKLRLVTDLGMALNNIARSSIVCLNKPLFFKISEFGTSMKFCELFSVKSLKTFI